jgi:HAD superfamily hydrolase (TIGR01549 family)
MGSKNGKNLDHVKLVIFDSDGVLFDIIEAVTETVRTGLEKYNIDADLQDSVQEVSHMLEKAQTMAIPEMILGAKELLQLNFVEPFTILKRLRIAISFYGDFQIRKKDCGLFEGIDELIKGLASRNIKMAILSNNKRSLIIENLKKKNLLKYFDQILGFNEVSKVKPDPEGLLKILELEKIKPQEALFIGDMVTDIQAGQNAGIRTIAITSGLVSPDKLLAAKPMKVVGDIYELGQFFGL